MTGQPTSTTPTGATVPPIEARDAALVKAADEAKTALAALAAAAEGPLFDPHTLYRALARLDDGAVDLTRALIGITNRLDAAHTAGLLELEDPDVAEGADVVKYWAEDALWHARRAAEDVRAHLRDAAEYTAAFKRRTGHGKAVTDA